MTTDLKAAVDAGVNMIVGATFPCPGGPNCVPGGV